jgi:SAM-dependent methyltransferase
MTATSEEPNHAAYFRFRDDLLGPSRTRILRGPELVDASLAIYRTPDGLSLYGVPATAMGSAGLRLLGRTVIECSVDGYVLPVAAAVAEIHGSLPAQELPMVVDLFCGSGNVGFHLGRTLPAQVYAAEIDPAVARATRFNFDLVGATIELHQLDYRDLLGKIPARGPRDTYVLEPPWGPAFSTAGLDLTRTSPPVPEVLDDIRRSRDGVPCLIIIKTNDQLANDSLRDCFQDLTLLRSVTPKPCLPSGANMDFHIYAMPGA